MTPPLHHPRIQSQLRSLCFAVLRRIVPVSIAALALLVTTPAWAVRAPATPDDEAQQAKRPAVTAPRDPVGFVASQDRGMTSLAAGSATQAAGLPFRSIAYASGSQPRTVTTADLDGDGYPDLIVPDNGSNQTLIRYGAPDGTYDGRQIVLTAGANYAQKAVAADFNGDGRLDIAVVHFYDGVYVWYQRGDGSFGSSGTFDVHLAPAFGFYFPCLAVGDVNGDGMPDLAVVSENSTYFSHGTVTLWTGPGPSGAWANQGVYDAQAANSDWIELADLNGDGALDFITTNDAPSSSVTVRFGNPTHTYPYFPSSDVFNWYLVGSGPNTFALADLNHDGHLDLVTANWNYPPFGGSVSVLLGRSDGTFDYARTTSLNTMQVDNGFAIGVGEFTGDSDPDLVIANGISGTLTLLPGHGDGTFASPRAFGIGSLALGIALTDVNGDGHTDVAVSNLYSRTVEVLTAAASGPFDGAVYPTGHDTPGSFTSSDANLGNLADGDVNGDGHIDLATIHPAAGTVSVILGNGDGSFGAPTDFDTGPNPSAVVMADFDGDGRQDLATTNRDNGTVSVLYGNGDGTFQNRTTYGVGKGPTALIAADMNGDGRPDIVTANYDESTISVLIKNKGAGFKDRVKYDVPAYPSGLSAGDVDGDGLTDLAVACQVGYVSILKQQGNGKLSAASNLYVYWLATGVALADLDRDGVTDLVMSSLNDDVVVYWRGTASGFSLQGYFPTPPAPLGMTVGDLDGDGWPEIEIAARSGQTSVLYPYAPTPPHGISRNWAFGSAGTDVVMVDANEDGKPDLITLNPRSQSVSVLLNASATAASMAARAADAPHATDLDAVSLSPNPLNPSATLRFTTSRTGPLHVRLYDVHGRLVRTLAEEQVASPGDHSIHVDGRSDAGSPLASGVYFYRIEASGATKEGRLTVLK